MRTFLRKHIGENPAFKSPYGMAGLLLLAAVYFLAAKFGFLMAYQAAQVTVVWPPTGIALAATLLYGPRVWPGIMLGAFLANVTTHESVLAALGISMGNTLESIIGAWLMCRFGNFDNAFGRLQDVWSLLLGAACGTMIGATMGVTFLCLDGVQPWTAWRWLWLLWWIGDFTSALIVTPLLLVWNHRPIFVAQWKSYLEAILLMAGLGAFAIAVFGNFPLIKINGRAFTYPVFPFIIWAAIRFGLRGITLVTLVISGIAIWATLHSIGPFAGVSVEQSLAMLQTFVAVVAITGLFLGAAITERRQAEAALRLSARNKNEFLSTLAHELRNPLAPVMNAVYMLRQPTITNDQRNKLHALIERQLQQIIRLVEDLVDVSRISQGKIELRMAPVPLPDAMALAIETVQPIVEERQHRMIVDLGPAPLWLNADLTRLAQIFSNLLNNAAKYTAPGGSIRVAVTADNAMATVTISDTGIGIPASALPRIFDMFMQVESSIEKSNGGLGIGLMLVKKLAELHGGKVSVSSPGKHKGSAFSVHLPLIAAPPAVAAIENETKTPPAQLQTFRILLADDNESFAETFGYMLRQARHDVRLAHDGNRACELAQAFLPDVVLLDIGLPGMSGYDVCKKLRAMPALANCTIVAQTGFGQQEHRERTREAGFDHHLVKPITMAQVEEILSRRATAFRYKAA